MPTPLTVSEPLSESVTLILLPFKCQYVTQIHVRKLIVACITGYDLLILCNSVESTMWSKV